MRRLFTSLLAGAVVVLGSELWFESNKLASLSRDFDELKLNQSRLEFSLMSYKTQASKREVQYVDRLSGLSKETYFRILRSTVRIWGGQRGGNQGTGVAIFSEQRSDPDDKGFYTYIVTCAHVVQSAKTVKIEQFEYVNDKVITSTTTYEKCNVVASDEKLDLAIVEVRTDKRFPATVPVISTEDLGRMSLNDPVFAAGCPLSSEPFVTNGNISSFNMPNNHHFQITAPIVFGNSGGGAYTIDGKLIGIVSAVRMIPNGSPYPHAGMVVPSWMLRSWAQKLRFGFIVGVADGTSLDSVIEARKIEEHNKSQGDINKYLENLSKNKLEAPKIPTIPRFK
jgi:S1-C subfamily serine protease